MKYIVHHPYNGKGCDLNQYDLKIGDEFNSIAGFIVSDKNSAICAINSEVGHHYFSRNDDGNGIERGNLTYLIAYSPREIVYENGSVFRLSEDEIKLLRGKWQDYIRPYNDVILFNNNFFNADIDILKQIANDLHMNINNK